MNAVKLEVVVKGRGSTRSRLTHWKRVYRYDVASEWVKGRLHVAENDFRVDLRIAAVQQQIVEGDRLGIHPLSEFLLLKDALR